MCRLWRNEVSIDLFCDSGVDVHETPAVLSWAIGKRVPPSVHVDLTEWGKNAHNPTPLKHLLPGLFLFGAIYKDTGRIIVITDRVNLNRAYVCTSPEATIITSHPTNLDLSVLNLSQAAIASYLANGSMIGDLSLFDELRLLEPARIYTFARGKPESSSSYWNQTFGCSQKFNRTKAKQDLKEAIAQSLRRCLDSERIVLSLSGGYDSSAILGFLKEVLHVRDVLCVSYVNGTPKAHSDAAVAAQQAEVCGYRHWIRQSYNGSAFQTIQRNALLGEGVAYFCEEVDAWCRLFNELEEPASHILLAGEQCFGQTSRSLGSPEEALRSRGVFGLDAIEPLKPYISSDLYIHWRELLAREIRRLLPENAEKCDPYDLRDNVSLRHKIPHVLLPWRRYVIGSSMPVRTPLLDGEVLEVATRLPVEERNGKRFFKELASETFPKIFSIPRAYYGQGFVPDWTSEIGKEISIFQDWINTTPSLLDMVISPQQQLAILHGALERPSAGSSRWTVPRAKERIRSTLFNIGLRTPWEHLRGLTRRRISAARVPLIQLAVRLLTMRAFLSEPVLKRCGQNHANAAACGTGADASHRER